MTRGYRVQDSMSKRRWLVRPTYLTERILTAIYISALRESTENLPASLLDSTGLAACLKRRGPLPPTGRGVKGLMIRACGPTTHLPIPETHVTTIYKNLGGVSPTLTSRTR